MSRTSRLYVIVICSIVFFLFTGWIVNTYIINPTFRSLEEKQAAEQASRAMASIKQDAGQVSALLSDWSTWDASYQFAKDRNALFIDENLRDWHSIEKDMHINLIYIYNRTGKKIYGRTYYGKKDLSYELPDFANDSILTSDFIQGVKLHGGRRTGILATNNGLMILVARPILKTDGQGPSSGVMIFGRFFDEARIDQISEEMNINFSVLLIQKSQLKGSERTVKNSLTPGLKKIVYLNDKELMLYELLIDVYGNQIGLLRTHVTTDLISMAQQVSVKIVVVMGIFMFALILIVLYSVKMKEGIRTDKRRPVNVGVIIVIGTGLIVTIALSGLLYEKKQREKQGSFRKLAQTQIAAVKNKLTDDLRELWEIKRFFDVSENVTREEFKRFVLPYMQNENFQAIEWIPEVHGEERNIYESAAKKDGFVNFTFTELGENKQLVRSVERPIYYPVFYVEPVQNNLSAVGYAPVHLPMRDEAIQRADSTGDASITGPFRLVQETGNQKGLMVFLPVKKSNLVVSGNEKVDCRKSFIACVYRVDDMLKSTRMTSVSENLFIELKDISYRHHEVLNQGKPIQLDDSDYVQHVEFGFAGRNYKISIAANSMFFDAHNDYEYVFVLLGGFLVTMFVSLYFNEILTQKERAEFLVDSRTKDLQESEERYQTFITQSTEGICRIEMNLAIPLTDISDTATGDLLGLGYYAECNDVYAAQMGYDNTSELVGKKANEILPFFGETFGLLYGDFFRNGFRLIDSEIQVVNAKGETKVFTEN
ncbi:MAG: CHASE domain-containing protein, partial [Ignavibacteriales bacterium]|nr:CHASE domain-containing protein [Ignavibacteriales bacterium]